MKKNLISRNDSLKNLSLDEALKSKVNLVWQSLGSLTVGEALYLWLSTLDKLTRNNYRSGMNLLTKRRLIDPKITLQSFALINHESIVDQIKLQNDWKENSRQARAACYISFTGFLARRTQGIIKKAIPSREGVSKTFFRYYRRVKTEAINQSQWIRFFEQLHALNPRDCLIGKLILQGGKRASEVLSVHSQQIYFDSNKIHFVQSKTKGEYRETVIFYPETIMKQLKDYLRERTGLVFITRNGKPIPHIQLYNTFLKASERAKLPVKVTPHVLRASTITFLKQQGFADSEIMKITGHASSEMVNAYDKTSIEENPTKAINLIN